MTPEPIHTLQALIQTDSALATQLQSATTLEVAAQLLAHAAHAKGIAADRVVIAEYLKAPMNTPLADAELEKVAGGRRPPPKPRHLPILPM